MEWHWVNRYRFDRGKKKFRASIVAKVINLAKNYIIFRNRDGNSGLNGKGKWFILPGPFFNVRPPEKLPGPGEASSLNV